MALGQDIPLSHPPQHNTYDGSLLNILYRKMMDGKQMRGEEWWTHRDEERSRSKTGKCGGGGGAGQKEKDGGDSRRMTEELWKWYDGSTKRLHILYIGKTFHWNSEWHVQKSYCSWLTIKIYEQNRIQLQKTQELYCKGDGKWLFYKQTKQKGNNFTSGTTAS